jgi:hypothetical protein
VSAGRVLRIAWPGLADSVLRLAGRGENVRLPAAEWLIARGRSRSAGKSGWRDWALDGAQLGDDVLERFPAGPCAIAAVSGSVPPGTWARADPVHLLTAIDHLQLAAPVPLPLDTAESAALLATLNDHLAGTGFALHAGADGGWLCECPAGLEFAAVEPSQAVGGNLRELLPTGRDASRVRALVNELQMVLHEHPVNEQRAARGLPAVNSVWLWGVGMDGHPRDRATGSLLTDDQWLKGLWRRHGGRVRPLDEFVAALEQESGDVRVALAQTVASTDEPGTLRQLDQDILAPARAMLAAARVSRVSLHSGRLVLDVPASARWACWRRPRPIAEVLA